MGLETRKPETVKKKLKQGENIEKQEKSSRKTQPKQ